MATLRIHHTPAPRRHGAPDETRHSPPSDAPSPFPAAGAPPSLDAFLAALEPDRLGYLSNDDLRNPKAESPSGGSGDTAMTDEHPIDRANRRSLLNDAAWINDHALPAAQELKEALLRGAERLIGGKSRVLLNQELAGLSYERVELYYHDVALFLDLYAAPHVNLSPCPVVGIWFHKPERTSARYYRVVPAIDNHTCYRWQDVTNIDSPVMFDSEIMEQQIFHWLLYPADFPSLQFSELRQRQQLNI